MIKPNFFIIGSPKCGTTALCGYLREHPHIFMCDPKEPFFFNRDMKKNTQIGWDDYLALFSGAVEGVHQAVGEGSTSYLISECAVRDILAFNPESKFIVILRNPIEIIQARHSQMIFGGEENILDFEAAWRAEKERRMGRGIPVLCIEPRKLFYSEWGNLGEQVERLFQKTRREKVKVIIFDDFKDRPEKTYAETLSFLGLSHDGRKDFGKVNENKSVLWPRLQRVLLFARRWVDKMHEKWNTPNNFGLFRYLRLLNSRYSKRPKISENLRRELADFYRADVLKLSGLIGRDLSHWVSDSDKEGQG